MTTPSLSRLKVLLGLFPPLATDLMSTVKYIWKRKFHLTTIPYIFCRYALVANVIYVLAQMHKLGKSCDAWYKFDGVISVLGRAALIGESRFWTARKWLCFTLENIVTFSLRTYAVSGCNKLLLGLIGLIGLSCVVLDIVGDSSSLQVHASNTKYL